MSATPPLPRVVLEMIGQRDRLVAAVPRPSALSGLPLCPRGCGVEARQGAQFCGACGARLGYLARAERRWLNANHCQHELVIVEAPTIVPNTPAPPKKR